MGTGCGENKCSVDEWDESHQRDSGVRCDTAGINSSTWSKGAKLHTTLCKRKQMSKIHPLRLLKVIFCPWIPRLEVPFVVTEGGVRGIGDLNAIITPLLC